MCVVKEMLNHTRILTYTFMHWRYINQSKGKKTKFILENNSPTIIRITESTQEELRPEFRGPGETWVLSITILSPPVDTIKGMKIVLLPSLQHLSKSIPTTWFGECRIQTRAPIPLLL